MAVCSPQELLAANPCLTNLSPHMLEVVETAKLCNLYNHLNAGEELTCDVEALIAIGACFYNLSSHDLRAVRVQLLCEIGALI